MNYSENDLLEEELEIITVFNYIMDRRGHNGYYSFYDNVENGYYIYKDDGKWVVNFNEKGQTTIQKKYTNVYNLLLDVLNDLKISSFYLVQNDLRMPRGTRVIISKSTDCIIDEIKSGIIVDRKKQALYGSNKPERIYTVLGDNGKVYTGSYGLNVYGDVCFRTMEDYIKDITNEIEENKGTMQELYETIWELYLTLNEVVDKKREYLEENNKAKNKY